MLLDDIKRNININNKMLYTDVLNADFENIVKYDVSIETYGIVDSYTNEQYIKVFEQSEESEYFYNIFYNFSDIYSSKYILSFFDIEALKYLDDLVDGYMLSPSALYKGKGIVAKTETYHHLKSFREQILEYNSEGKNVFIYSIKYVPIFPKWIMVSDETIKEPVIPDYKPYWVIRYSVYE